MPGMEKKLAYKDQPAQMGVIEFYCIPTGDRFAKAVIDTKGIDADSLRLDADIYPNSKLQKLWSLYGDAGFKKRVASLIEAVDPAEDHSEDLQKLMDAYLKEYPDAVKM